MLALHLAAPLVCFALSSHESEHRLQIGERLVPSIVFNGGASPFMTFVLASILRYRLHPPRALLRKASAFQRSPLRVPRAAM